MLKVEERSEPIKHGGHAAGLTMRQLHSMIRGPGLAGMPCSAGQGYTGVHMMTQHIIRAGLLAMLITCTKAAPSAGQAMAGGERGQEATPQREVLATFENPGGGRAVFHLEVADTPEAREKGLMYRRSLDKDRGMLFVFPVEDVQHFWMKNTYIPLDMIFISKDLTVVGVAENARPLTETLVWVPAPSQYVVEVNAYTARAKGIGKGSKVRFEPPISLGR